MAIITNLDQVVDDAVSTNVNVIAANQAVVDATTKASEASASATSAGTSASDALGYKNDAEQAVIDAAAQVVLASVEVGLAADQVTLAQAEVVNAQAEVTAAGVVKTEVEALKVQVLDYRNDTLDYLVATGLKYDEFDDRYLGAFASDPLTDNDGQAIREGAIYWDMIIKGMKVWTGVVWSEIAAASGALLLANNLADLPDKIAARTNLGVENTNQLDARDTVNRDRANHTGTQSIDTVVDSGTHVKMTVAEQTKLGTVESGATGDQTAVEIEALYEGIADTNKYTDAEKTKLGTIETDAKDDQVASEVPVTPQGNLSSNTVQLALEELQNDIDALTSDVEW